MAELRQDLKRDFFERIVDCGRAMPMDAAEYHSQAYPLKNNPVENRLWMMQIWNSMLTRLDLKCFSVIQEWSHGDSSVSSFLEKETAQYRDRAESILKDRFIHFIRCKVGLDASLLNWKYFARIASIELEDYPSDLLSHIGSPQWQVTIW